MSARPLPPLLLRGECIAVMRSLPADSVDAVVTDPPYGLEFMGKGWDAPWADTDINADAGFKGGGLSQTRNLPSFTGSTNPKCLACKGTQRGRRDGTAKVAVCLCPDGGRFPNVRGVEMRAFQHWCEQWAREALRVLKPGGYLLAFGGSRTWHRLAAGIEDAGFEMRDSIAWLYGSGFPKSLDVSKAIDKAAGAERRETSRVKGAGIGGGSTFTDDNWKGIGAESFAKQDAPATPDAERWQGWGTALKPAFEPVVVARKPLGAKTVAANVLAHGTGALNIDATRVASGDAFGGGARGASGFATGYSGDGWAAGSDAGRWPANVMLDESQAAALDAQSGTTTSQSGDRRAANSGGVGFTHGGGEVPRMGHLDTGGASRFFYVAKAPKSERPVVDGVAHPTVKPLALMRYLCRLVTQPGGLVLDPFAGSGTTLEAAHLEGFEAIGVEMTPDYWPLIDARIARAIVKRATETKVADDA
jgi:site-specific DNA-methyltransferase (adenine-specific)